MIPQEKAKDLVDKYLCIDETFNVDLFCDECGMSNDAAKYCALIAVNEIMFWNPREMLYTVHVHRFKTLQELDLNKCQFEDSMIVEKITALEYWNQVKQEIEKL